MGMYTQYRGVLCVHSIGHKHYDYYREKLAQVQDEFKSLDIDGRPWVCEDTTIFQGSNFCIWLFIGTEYKDYDKDFDRWIRFLHSKIPCEGRIERQCEESKPGDEDNCYILTKDSIRIEPYLIHTEGYGFQSKEEW